MKLRPKGDTRRRAIVILHGIQPTAKSAADVADTINTLSSSFEVNILTNGPAECRKIFPETKITPLPLIPFRGEVLAFCIECWVVLPFVRGNLIYVAGVEYSPSIAMNVGKPVLCYGNSNPIQHATNTRRKGGRLSALLSRINDLGMTVGLRRCDMILAISPQLGEVFKARGVPASKIRELALGVPLGDFDPRGRRTSIDSGHIWTGIYHGTLSEDRGLRIIVEGARMLALRRRDFRIKLVGCGPKEETMVRELISKAGVEEYFTILPPVAHAEIPSMLWSADFGISLLEPNAYFATSPPVKVLEYLAAGLPVIANNLSTHSLYLKDGDNSLIIPYNAESFADAMDKFIEDGGLRARLAASALRSAEKFSDESTHRTVSEAALSLVDD